MVSVSLLHVLVLPTPSSTFGAPLSVIAVDDFTFCEDDTSCLVAVIHYNRGKLFVRHVLTHKEYDLGKWKNK